MKLSKSIVIAISSILCISSFSLLTYASDKELKTDLKNAIQTIDSITFINKGSQTSSSGTLSKGENNLNLKITTKNLIITLTGGDANTINNSKGSSILGGKKNTINNGNTGTILGGYSNTINGNSSTIGGGLENTIKGNNSTIIGGYNNTITGNYSTILGSNNKVSSKNSSIIGTNNKVNGDSSFALGSGGIIETRTSNVFLWNDGENTTTSKYTNTFSIISKNGMVINSSEVANSAQLTISGSLNIFENYKNKDIQCGSGNGAGILKVMNKGNNMQVCFCSCDGENRSSIFGKGQCEGICKGGTLEPKCTETIQKEFVNEDKYYLTGGCENGKIVVLKDNQSWYKDGENTQYRACQTDDGTTITCKGKITNN